ncbi:MAG: leucine-rich repeat protein [Clostridia bacterium]|nr:leucine-rich repeat protein [Clostridia bacterium]
MKRKIEILLLSLILTVVVTVGISSATKGLVIQPGDVNGDGAINAKDAVMLAQYLAGWDVVLGGDSNTVVIDAAVPATCTQTGLTEGKHCSDCGMILVKQQVVPMTEHDYEDTVVPPTETEKGYTFHKCKNCGHEMTDSYTGATLAKGLEYTIANGACTITGIGTCTETEVHIPERIENCPVTAIADKAFEDQTQITKIGLPSTMKTLGQRAFYGCTGLTEFTVPASVTNVGHQVFYKCDNLATVYYNSSFSPDKDKVFLNIPSIKTVVFGGDSVPYQICYNCANIENVTVKDSVTSIGNHAFYNCSRLTSIDIPNGVLSIGHYAFGDCTGLTGMEIPNSVTSIGHYAFGGCSSLTGIEIPDSVTRIGSGTFSGCSSLDSITLPFVGESRKNTSRTYQYPFGYIFGTSSYTGGISITQSYYGSSSLWPTSSTFYIPSSLKSVTITGGDIPYGAFSNCSTLSSITLGDSVTSIDYEVFHSCSSLTSLYINDLESWLNVNLSAHDSHPLYSAGGNLYIDGVLATDIEIPDTVSNIKSYVFEGCKSITSVTIPSSVTSIGNSAFYNCSSLISIEIPRSVTSIGNSAFYNCSSLTSVEIPDSVTSIGDSAFAGCSSCTSVEIPDSVTSIGIFAFNRCSRLTSVEIPDSVTSIGDSAFSSCNSLASIEIPDSVRSMGEDAFWGCSSLTTVYYGGYEEDWATISFGLNVWSGVPSSLTVYYYSATQPTESGNYWRYVDGKPTPW